MNQNDEDMTKGYRNLLEGICTSQIEDNLKIKIKMGSGGL